MSALTKPEIRSEDNAPVNILWTGGWDSTFRCLQLILAEKKEVQPYYIIDSRRKSSEIEMETMKKIKDHLFQKYPESQSFLRTVIYKNMDEIDPDEEIFDAWKEIRNKRHIGSQYKWLASYCKQHQINDIELCLDKSTNKHNFENTLTYRLSENPVSRSYQVIFQYFSLPLVETSKMEMAEIAEKNGWISILEMTWFCHRPVHIPFYGKIPCGGCNPCLFTIEEGLGYRLPFFSRVFGKHLKAIYHSAFIKKMRKT
ncbi:MAG: hypothetical protein GVY07_05425 [Bacteroidetes bacterium]|nr:hypothetical protein [Bacteroidota bacterium]